MMQVVRMNQICSLGVIRLAEALMLHRVDLVGPLGGYLPTKWFLSTHNLLARPELGICYHRSSKRAYIHTPRSSLTIGSRREPISIV